MRIDAFALVAFSLCIGSAWIADAQTSDADTSALACTAAYQIDWLATTSSERSAADRKGAETTYAAYRAQNRQADDAAKSAITQKTTAMNASVRSGAASLTEIVAACDKAWSENASQYATQYAPPPTPPTSSSGEADTLQTRQAQSASPAPASTASAQCETTDRRAEGIMNTWKYAVQDYAADGVRDYDRERTLSDMYRSLRSRLESEMRTAETYGCDDLAGDIRYGLNNWENPF
jgi:hypothetical protein